MIKRSYFLNKAQALTELAVFSSLLLLMLGMLLQWGINLGNSEYLRMEAFRRAFNQAKSEGNVSVQEVNYVLIREKKLPNPTDVFGFTPRSSINAYATAIWSKKLFYEQEYNTPNELPKIWLDFGSKTYKLTTANFKGVNCDDHGCRKKEDDEDDEHLLNGSHGHDKIYYYWKQVDEIESGDEVDVDGDNKVETALDDGTVLDSQDGEIDTTITAEDIDTSGSQADVQERLDNFVPGGFSGNIKKSESKKNGEISEFHRIETAKGATIAARVETSTRMRQIERFWYRIYLNYVTGNIIGQIKDGDCLTGLNGDPENSADHLDLSDPSTTHRPKNSTILWVKKEYSDEKDTIWRTQHD